MPHRRQSLAEPAGGNVDRGPFILALQWATTSVALLVIVARLYVRSAIIKYRGWDDYLIVFSIINAIGAAACDTLAVQHGYGHHGFYLSDTEATTATKWNYLAIPFSLMSNVSAKLSICFFMLHINQEKRYARILVSVGCLVFALVISNCIYVFTQCRPASALWTGVGKCLDPKISFIFGIFTSIIFILADVTFATFPLTFLWDLNLNMRKKFAIGFVLSLGLIAAAFGIVRCTQLVDLQPGSDILFETIDITIWSFLEQNVTITAASIPVLYKLFSNCLNSRKSGPAITGYTIKNPTNESVMMKGGRSGGRTSRIYDSSSTRMDGDFGEDGNYMPLDDVQTPAAAAVEDGKKVSSWSNFSNRH
ncbi:hypothetical protein G7Y89_g1526 [Cudoniella acicularis]|uniref:Rhodopsin domain-containing protein n=1 Tax=Cudoniella acicularis TaxID=354080 RepID=A0A8H4W7C2_9HELO|nr:hypothetical protein G7Y89_g1526 [Cudoniella acicularis]